MVEHFYADVRGVFQGDPISREHALTDCFDEDENYVNPK